VTPHAVDGRSWTPGPDRDSWVKVFSGHVQRVSSPRLRVAVFAKNTLIWLGDGRAVASRGDDEGPCSEAQSPAGAALYESSSRLDDAHGSHAGARVAWYWRAREHVARPGLRELHGGAPPHCGLRTGEVEVARQIRSPSRRRRNLGRQARRSRQRGRWRMQLQISHVRAACCWRR